MANHTPHIVGGGLGSFGKVSLAKQKSKVDLTKKSSQKAAISAMRPKQ